MDSYLIVALVVVVLLIVLIIFLKKKSADKVSSLPSSEEELSMPLPGDDAESEPEPLDAAGIQEVFVETEEAATVTEPEDVLELAAVEEPETFVSSTEEVRGGSERIVALSRELYEQRLFILKEKKLAELATAIDENDEEKREEFQVELVAITEALTFVDHGYEHELSCRTDALAVLDQSQEELDPVEFDRASESIINGDTEEAEQVFEHVVEMGTAYAASAAYQSGRLAECRLDFNAAMERFERAVALDATDVDALRSAALLARRLYDHKKSMVWFTALVDLLEKTGEDSVELALARRDFAYSLALDGKYNQAGRLYKKAMISLSKLLGQDDPEMGICWFQIGKLQEALGQYEKAEEPYTKALAIMDKAGNRREIGSILDKLAALYMELEREPEAIPVFERLCTFKEESSKPDKVSLIMACNNLAEAYRISGKYSQAEARYHQSLLLTEELHGKDHAAVGSILQELTQICQRQGKTAEAKNYQERASAIFEHVLEEQEAKGQQLESLTLSD